MEKANQKKKKSGINKNTDKVLFDDEYYDKIDEIERISDEEFFSDLIATEHLDFSRKRIFNF